MARRKRPVLGTDIGIDIGTMTAEQARALVSLVDGLAVAYRDALLYGDGSMPDWVKHRIDPLDPRWQGAVGEPTDG